MLNPIYGLCPYMVSGSGFPANCVEFYRLLGLIFLSHCVESHIWSLPIYGLCPYMAFGSGFPANCVESYRLSIPYMVFGSSFPVPTALNPMVFGSGFPVPTVLNPMVFGSGFPVPTVLNQSHIWSLGSVSIPYMVFGSNFNPIYGLWVRFPCPNCVEFHIWSLGPVSLSHLC